MPWIDVDGQRAHYTPARGSTATEEQVRDEIRRCVALADEQKAKRLSDMPDQAAALHALGQAYQRLSELGWRDAIYCPKDGSEFDVIEAGSTGVHRCHYVGKWPDGSWWIAADGDLWPSRPILFRALAAVQPDVAAPAAHSPVIERESSRAEPLNPSETNHG